MDSREHNAKVRRVADRLPAGAVRKTYLAFGYAASFDDATVRGFTIAALAKLTQDSRRRDPGSRISDRRIKAALPILEAHGLIRQTRHRGEGILNGRSEFWVNLDWDGDGEPLAKELQKATLRKRESAPKHSSGPYGRACDGCMVMLRAGIRADKVIDAHNASLRSS
jgi:hypothetical protein